MDRRALARELERVDGFSDPDPALEQYPTPAEIAAHLLHLAALRDDLDRPVVDLGTGTGVLAVGAALAGSERVLGLDRDREAVRRARTQERDLLDRPRIEWIVGDATDPPLCVDGTTVVMNPPFGAQDGNEGADRAFLRTAAEIGTVSYSLHNAGSREFVTSFAADNGGEVTDSFAVRLALDRQFEFHEDATREIDAEAYRIEWTGER